MVTILASMRNLINFSLAHYKIHQTLISSFCQDQLHKNFHLLLSCKMWYIKIILWKVAWNYREYIHNLDVLYQLTCEMKSSPPKRWGKKPWHKRRQIGLGFKLEFQSQICHQVLLYSRTTCKYFSVFKEWCII